MPLKIGDDACFDKDGQWVSSCAVDSLCYHCCCGCVWGCCMPSCPGMFDDEETKKCETEAPGSTAVQHRDMSRCSRGGINSHGIVYNTVGGLISRNWGFDLREIKCDAMKVLISYNLNDKQCGSTELLPQNPHGQWLVNHFTKNAAKCEVNVGGKDDKKAPNQHGAQQFKMVNGQMVAQLAAM